MNSPTTLTDPVLKLAEYWLSAKVMHELVQALEDVYGDIKEIDAAGAWLEYKTYLEFWLSSLYVTAEGFNELKLHDPALTTLIDRHIGNLKLFRNATFHFQKSPQKHVQFFDGNADRWSWAEELHEAFGAFFGNYAS